MLSFAAKMLSPTCIILFYLSGISIIIPILNKFNITNLAITSSDSIRVAVDSAIITLLVNFVLSVLNSPIKVEVEAKSRQELDQVVTFCDRHAKIDYQIKLNYKHKLILDMYLRYLNPIIRINNTKNTSLNIDKEDQYEGIINCSFASKYIDIDLSKLPNSGRLYFTLLIQSDKTIKWDDEIKTELHIRNKEKLGIHTIFWQVRKDTIKVVHREEII